MKNKQIDQKLAVSKDLEEQFKSFRTDFDPSSVIEKSVQDIAKSKKGSLSTQPESNIFKAMTLFEFDNGILMSTALAEQYKTFAINLSRDLQKEFECKTPSEKATVEVVAINFVRTLEIQRKINSFLALGSITDMGIRFLSVLSKELDRAQRHYLSSLQTLKTLKQPVFQLKVKADTAVVGQNQLVQTNKYE